MDKNRVDFLKESSEKSCDNKNFHRTKQLAKNKAKRVKANGGLPTWPYKCNNCNGYHLTSNKDAKLKVALREIRRDG